MGTNNSAGYNGNSRNESLNNLVEQVQNKNIKSYIVDRIIPQMKWYSDTGKRCKKQYHFWMTVSILLGALIPIVSIFADGSLGVKILLAALGSGVTTCNAYITLHNFRNQWLNYRNVRERLLRTLYYYFNNAGIFAQSKTPEEKDILLVNICEEEMANETKEWLRFEKVD